jgi:putative membrane protein
MMNWYGPGMGWGTLLMTLNSLVFAGVLAGAVYLVVRYVVPGRRPEVPTGPNRGPESGSDPERALAERFARGQIDDEEYRRRLTVLRGAKS